MKLNISSLHRFKFCPIRPSIHYVRGHTSYRCSSSQNSYFGESQLLAGCECSLSAYSQPPWDLCPSLPSFIYSESWPASTSPLRARMFWLRTRAPSTMEMPQPQFLVGDSLPFGMRLLKPLTVYKRIRAAVVLVRRSPRELLFFLLWSH